jgi:hypothetical protein
MVEVGSGRGVSLAVGTNCSSPGRGVVAMTDVSVGNNEVLVLCARVDPVVGGWVGCFDGSEQAARKIARNIEYFRRLFIFSRLARGGKAGCRCPGRGRGPVPHGCPGWSTGWRDDNRRCNQYIGWIDLKHGGTPVQTLNEG